MLLELAIADGYGVGYEYVDEKVVKEYNKGYSYRQHPLHNDLKPGDYSDDTQMSIAVAEYIVDNGSKQDMELFAEYVFNVFKRNPIKGYSKGFQTVLETVQSPKELLEALEGHNTSDKNGGAMRAVPCGVFKNKQTVKDFAAFQASLTHGGRGIVAAQATALASHYFRFDLGTPDNLGKFLNRELNLNETWEWSGKVKSPTDLGMITVKASLFAVMCTDSLHDCLIQSVDYCGDVDTVAAIAVGVASQSKYHKKNLADSLVYNLRKDKYGIEYLKQLDERLNTKC